jgi:molybdenum cofactor synthesis domain-containing protein
MTDESRTRKALVLTISDSASEGTREDLSGPEVCAILRENGFEVVSTEVLPDERTQIQDRLRFACDRDQVRLIVTTGGTGLSPRDVTPDATARVINREVPGMAELMRLEGLKQTPRAALSRGLVGARGMTLIVNLPGSVKGVRESLGALLPILPHAIEVLGASSLGCGE